MTYGINIYGNRHKFENMSSDKQSLIRKSALKTFAIHGFDGSSIRMIASEAGLNHQKITYYFQTKENLLISALEEAFKDLHEIGDALVFDPEKQDPLVQYRAHLKQVARYFAANPEFLKIIYLETLSNSPRIGLIRSMIHSLRNSVKRELVFLKNYGFGNGLPIDELMLIFSGSFHAYFIHPYVHQEIREGRADITLDKFVDRICDLLMQSD